MFSFKSKGVQIQDQILQEKKAIRFKSITENFDLGPLKEND